MTKVSRKPVRKKKPTKKKGGVQPTVKRKKKLSKKVLEKKVESLITNYSGQDETYENLSEGDKHFCELYATDRDFFANGVQCYIKAFDVNLAIKGAYDKARFRARDLLTNPHILGYINHIMELGELNDSFVDRQHAMLIIQNGDMGVKMNAIKHYDVKKGRIIKKIKLNTDKSSPVSPEEKGLIDEIFDDGD